MGGPGNCRAAIIVRLHWGPIILLCSLRYTHVGTHMRRHVAGHVGMHLGTQVVSCVVTAVCPHWAKGIAGLRSRY